MGHQFLQEQRSDLSAVGKVEEMRDEVNGIELIGLDPETVNCC